MATGAPNDIKRRIGKVGRYHLWLYLLPVFSIMYYGWFKAPELNERPDNPQRIAPLSKRGRLLDRDGNPWALNVDGRRVYPLGEAAGPLVGYQLLGRNHTGLEASLQGELSPPLPPSNLSAAIEQDREIAAGTRLGLEGPDIRLTLDKEIQTTLYALLRSEAGALVVADDNGHVLAAVSSPSFDPNEIEETWQEVRDDEQGPFIERVGSGLYPVVLSSGESLLNKEQTFSWLQSNPFPNYPNASSAIWMEDRLLVSPLMLLQLSYWNDTSPENPVITIFPELKDSNVGPYPLQVPESPRQEPSGLKVWQLDGPPYRSSPRFLACFGTTLSRLHFALVIEGDTPSARATMQRCLEAIGRPAAGSAE